MEEIIEGDEFKVAFDFKSCTIKCEGSLRLNDRDKNYIKVVSLFNHVAENSYEKVTLNLQDLHFLNSLGIGVISKFVIQVRNNGESHLSIVGARSIPWQSKLLRNLVRLMPSLESSLS
jgi:hypothetical protein